MTKLVRRGTFSSHLLVWRKTMYAVIRTGGKQYTVKAGDLIKVEKLEKELKEIEKES